LRLVEGGSNDRTIKTVITCIFQKYCVDFNFELTFVKQNSLLERETTCEVTM